jgi:hypothetical protein
MSDAEPKVYRLDGEGIEIKMVKHVMDALDDHDRLFFLMHQMVIHCAMAYESPNALIDQCLAADRALRFRVPEKFAKQLMNLCKTQSRTAPEAMMTRLLAGFFTLGVEMFALQISTDPEFKKMHRKVADAIGGVLGTDMESKENPW